jgi:hypothetical protein
MLPPIWCLPVSPQSNCCSETEADLSGQRAVERYHTRTNQSVHPVVIGGRSCYPWLLERMWQPSELLPRPKVMHGRPQRDSHPVVSLPYHSLPPWPTRG